MTTPLPMVTYASGTLRIPNRSAASATIRYPSGNWVGLIRTEVARSWAYRIARTHQMISGSRGSRNTSWTTSGSTET